MELKKACDVFGVTRDDIYSTAKALASHAFLAGKMISPATCYSALQESAIIAPEDRAAIIDGLNHARRQKSVMCEPIGRSAIDWQEPPIEWNETVVDYQTWCARKFALATSGHAKTRADYAREHRSHVAFLGAGGTFE